MYKRQVGALEEIFKVANDDFFLAVYTSGGVLKIFAGCVSNVSTMGPLIDAMIAAGQPTDPLNFKEFSNLNIVPSDETLH